MPVEVERGDVPTGLELGRSRSNRPRSRSSGPASVIARVVGARADVIIQPSGLDIDQDVELVPVDSVGDAVGPVDLDPPTARVTIPVFSDRQTRTLPVSPQLTGTPAAGFAIASVDGRPHGGDRRGRRRRARALAKIDTEPISVAGVSAATTVTLRSPCPPASSALDVRQVEVTIGVRAVTATRNFEVGLRLVGARAGPVVLGRRRSRA